MLLLGSLLFIFAIVWFGMLFMVLHRNHKKSRAKRQK